MIAGVSSTMVSNLTLPTPQLNERSNMRDTASELLQMCRDGLLDPMAVLENVLVNYMSADDANDFAESEYLDM